MSTVRINDDIKKEVMPILEELGLSLSEAINIFLHQVKLNNGIPFELKKKSKSIELHDGYGSYVCDCGHIHNYSRINFGELEEEARRNKTYNSAEELFADIESDSEED